MYLCLDLALRNTGWALFSEKGELLALENLARSKTSALEGLSAEVRDMAKRIYDLTKREPYKSKDLSTVIIEDIYHNRNFKNEKWMARLSGAVIKTFDTEIKFYQASQARRLAGIKGTAHKAEIQIYVLDSLKKANTTKFKKQIEELNKEFDKTALSKQIRKTKNKTEKKKLKKERTKLNGRRKYRLNKLSKLIEKETGYSEHICDAIILGKAYRQEQLQT